MEREPEIALLFPPGDGRLARLARSVRLASDSELRSERIALVSLLVTWLPLLVLSALEGRLRSNESDAIGFASDYLPHTRYLLVVPLLLGAERFVAQRLQTAVMHFQRCRIVLPEDLPALQDAVLDLARAWRSPRAGVVLLLLALVMTGLEWNHGIGGAAAAWQRNGETLSVAGAWHLLVSQPVMRFLVYRWLFRMLVWARALYRIASLPLALIPEHPDRAGGLAFVGMAQSSFAFFAFANACQLAGLLADRVVHAGDDLLPYRPLVFSYALLALVVVFGPLAPFAAPMAAAQRQAQLRMSRWIAHAARYVRSRLDADTDAELAEELRGAEISSIADAGAVFDNVRFMQPFPAQRRHLAIVLAASMLPFLPLALLVIPARDLFEKIVAVVL